MNKRAKLAPPDMFLVMDNERFTYDLDEMTEWLYGRSNPNAGVFTITIPYDNGMTVLAVGSEKIDQDRAIGLCDKRFDYVPNVVHFQ